MSEAQIFETPRGEELVILPKEDYEALLDRLALAKAGATYEAIMAGERETFPSELVDALLSSDGSQLKLFREYRGLAAEDVAEQAGITVAQYLDMENRAHDDLLLAFHKIAIALDIDMSLLAPAVPMEDEEEPIDIEEIEIIEITD